MVRGFFAYVAIFGSVVCGSSCSVYNHRASGPKTKGETMLALADLDGKTDQEVIEHIIEVYETNADAVKRFRILIAYEYTGSNGCDSSSFYLLMEKSTGKLFEVHGSHCSCYGFEDQWKPEETTLDYLKSDNFSFYCGGYDDDEILNKSKVKNFINRLNK